MKKNTLQILTKRLTFLFFIGLSFTISAQNVTTKKADKLFNRFEYVDSAKEYLKLSLTMQL